MYLNNLRLNIDDYTEGATFSFYPGLDGESIRWETSPLGTVFSIDLWGPESGSVVATEYTPENWIFSTVYTPEDGWHPVSGNRKFGYTHNGDSTVTFYTRATDRISTNVNDWINWAFDQTSIVDGIFEGGGKVWSGLTQVLADDLGSTSVRDSTIYRTDYDQIENVLNGDAPVSSLVGCD